MITNKRYKIICVSNNLNLLQEKQAKLAEEEERIKSACKELHSDWLQWRRLNPPPHNYFNPLYGANRDVWLETSNTYNDANKAVENSKREELAAKLNMDINEIKMYPSNRRYVIEEADQIA